MVYKKNLIITCISILAFAFYLLLPKALPQQAPQQTLKMASLSVVTLSDLHGQHEGTRLQVPPGDILILAGDIEISNAEAATK